MCLHPTHSRVKTADKDIVVYKCLYKKGNKLFSPHQDFKYTLNKLYKVDTKLNDKSLKNVNKGLHAYQNLYKAKNSAYCWGYELYKAIIPKGSIYKLGLNEDIVSNQLIVKKRINL